LKPARRRELARWIRERFGASVQQACRLALLRRSTWYRRSHAKDQTPLRMRIRELALNRPRFGYLRIHVLLRREGWLINRKRVHRLYRLDGLQVRMRVRRRKRLSLHRGPVPMPSGANQHWSMDFVHDQLLDGRSFRILTVIDQWSRESVSVEPGFSLSGASVAAALDLVAQHRLLPKAITSTTAPNSRPARSTNGRGNAGYSSTSFGPVSLWKTGSSNRSTDGYETSA